MHAFRWLDRPALIRMQAASKHFYLVVVPKVLVSLRIFDRQNILLMTNSTVMRILDKNKLTWHELNLQGSCKQKKIEGSIFAKHHYVFQVNKSEVYVLGRGWMGSHVLSSS